MTPLARAIPVAVALALCAAGAVRADRPTVETLNRQWDQTFNQGDAARLAVLYHPAATVSPGNGKVVAGRAEIEKLFKGFFEAGAHNHQITVVEAGGSGNLLHQVAHWTANGPEKDGRKPVWKGVLASTFQKGANGQWLATSHVWNTASD